MSNHKSARYFAEITPHTHNTTTSMFIRNHTSPEQLLSQVEVLFSQGHLHEAHHIVECVVDNYNPLIASADLFTLHAKIYIELFGFNIHAECAVEQALLLEPKHTEALRLKKLSSLHEELRDGMYETAVDSLRALITSEPQNIYAKYLLANHLFWKNGSQAEAVELLESVVQERPSFLKSWVCLAMAYKKGQNLVKAETAFQECLALDTNVANQEFYKKHLQSL